MILLGILASFSVLASELPLGVAMATAVAALLQAAWLARREMRRRPIAVVVPSGRNDVTIDGNPVAGFDVVWRGPFAFARWRDARGCWRRLQGWPDNLDPASRRELRLAVDARLRARAKRSMAP